MNTTKRRHSGIGSEPGINPRDDKYGHFTAKCTIHLTEYSSEHVSLSTLDNAEFVELMKLPREKPHDERPSLEKDGKRTLRWINIGGISWDVLSALALRYDLHSLALEDILHEQGHNQSKADYYRQHLFLRILCHSLPTEEDPGPDPRSEYPGGYTPDEPPRNDLETMAGFVKEGAESKLKHRRFSALSGFRLAARQRRILQIAALTKGDRVVVKHEPMFIFLLREGTVISIHPTPNLEFTEPVTERMHQHDSVLRTSEDPAILVEGLLDLIVDRILEVMDEYQDKIHQLEHDILMKPGMSTVRSLHILSGDLIMHKRTLEPIKSMLYGLRRYDQDRCAAMGFGNDIPSNRRQVETDRHGSDAGLGVGVGAGWHNQHQEGYMSSKSKIYLADVYDHMDFILTSLDMFSGISENLINYAFNMASYEMNQVMRRLTLATIIFLPLTLLTGYFGMNFTAMWSIHNYSDVLFWIIALPVMGAIIPMFLYSDIKKMLHYFSKVMAARRAVLAEERAARHPW
ncbi:magnesium transporter [Mycena alexandri]|uniref:Magnesium transporter n=1 Tax=Mycena alexandri TaxID=1745969 RepID=A0AAD6XCV0_9AGAR|nr:magnesium transporter [Mycena alexandri]